MAWPIANGMTGLAVRTLLNAFKVDYDARIDKYPLGTSGGLERCTVEVLSAELSGASAAINLAIPAGARLRGVELNNAEVILFAGGGTVFNAALTGGADIIIGASLPATLNAKANKLIEPVDTDGSINNVITTGTTVLTVTPDNGTFLSGKIRAIAYYDKLNSIADV